MNVKSNVSGVNSHLDAVSRRGVLIFIREDNSSSKTVERTLG